MPILIEDVIILIIVGMVVFFVGIPIVKAVAPRLLAAKKSDPLEDAKLRLNEAKRDLEAARINKHVSEIYDEIVEEAEDDSEELLPRLRSLRAPRSHSLP